MTFVDKVAFVDVNREPPYALIEAVNLTFLKIVRIARLLEMILIGKITEGRHTLRREISTLHYALDVTRR